MKSSLLVAAATTSCAHAFVPSPACASSRTLSSSSQLNMGLFDGVKEAFGADGMGELDSERETPIDRWMGWNAKSDKPAEAVGSKAPVNFVDSMDGSNYVTVTLSKPMGIVFEENDVEFGGIFVLDLSEGGVAETDGAVHRGDQLISVGNDKVSGLQFEDALGKIIDTGAEERVKLVFFRGPAKFLYGPAGASQEWLDEFIKGGAAKKVEEAA